MLRVQGQWLGGHYLFVGIRVAFGNLRRDFDEILVLQLANGLGGGVGEAQQLLQRDGSVFLDDMVNLRLPFRETVNTIPAGPYPHKEAFAPAFLFLSHGIGQHALEGGLGRAAIVVGHPVGQPRHARCHQRLRTDNLENGLERIVRRRFGQGRHAAEHLSPAEGNFYARAHLHPPDQFGRYEVVKLSAQGNLQCHTRDHVVSLVVLYNRGEPNKLTGARRNEAHCLKQTRETEDVADHLDCVIDRRRYFVVVAWVKAGA